MAMDSDCRQLSHHNIYTDLY